MSTVFDNGFTLVAAQVVSSVALILKLWVHSRSAQVVGKADEFLIGSVLSESVDNKLFVFHADLLFNSLSNCP